MIRRLSRRFLLKRSAALGAGLWLVGSRVKADAVSPNEKLNVAMIGVGGQGEINVKAMARNKTVNLVAFCDVDEQRAKNVYKQYPKTKKYYDFRRMLDELDDEIDGVVVSTPDHTHFHAAMTVMQHGKHCYCEKPMAHAIGEVRAMTRLAAEKKLATQLGVQRHAIPNVHRVVELVRSGAIGPVRECHAWVGGDRGMPAMPTEFPPVPAHLKWDLWLGPVAERPYSPAYVPYTWRFWWDFGTGEMGNWGCHILDIPFWALGLKYPTRAGASGPPVDPQRTPKSAATWFEFPARGSQPAVKLHWSHTKSGPAVLAEHKMPHFDMGALFVGDDGMLLCNFSKHRLYPESKFADFQPPEPSVPDSPGFYREWVDACRGGPAATCAFDYSGPLAETVLLGNLAYRLGKELAWDAESVRATNCPEAEPLWRPTYREGWRDVTV